MSLSTLATLGITLTGRTVVTAGKIQALAAQDRAVCTSMAQAYITAPLPLFTSPSKAEQVIDFICAEFFFFFFSFYHTDHKMSGYSAI